MKRAMLLLCFVLLGSFAIAQNLVETVYLNNGSIIKGTVIEQSKEGVKIQTRDGSVFVYKMSEVQKITKEAPQTVNNQSIVNSTVNYKGGLMERGGGELFLNGQKLSDDKVLQLVGRQNFEKTYLPAKGQYLVGNRMVTAGAILTAIGGTVLITGTILQYTVDNDFVWMAVSGDAVFGVGFGAVLPVGLVLRSIGKGRLNWVANDYNSRGKGLSLQVSPFVVKPNVVGNQGNMAYGATIKLSF